MRNGKVPCEQQVSTERGSRVIVRSALGAPGQSLLVETALHRELKELYGGAPECREVPVLGYRIDAVVGSALVEIQQASLAAMRRKTRELLAAHDVIIVKPLAETTTIL